jgi:deazaflavin-dependent oxidoreductase (nitroreductase family)
MKTLNRIANPFLKWLLRSPLHVLLSNALMLITVTGRKSGKAYTTPVQYKHDDGAVLVISALDRTWWKNVRGGAPVTLHLRGRLQHGHAVCVEDSAAVAALARRMYPNLAPERLARFVEGKVVIRVQIQPDGTNAAVEGNV